MRALAPLGTRWTAVAVIALILGAGTAALAAEPGFRAGAAAVDVTPQTLPVVVSGGVVARQGTRIVTPLYARSLVLSDGATQIALCVVDSLFVPRELADKAKLAASRATGIRPDHILISAIHTHSAPSLSAALGTGVDEAYARQMPNWIVESIAHAAKNLAPAQAGWTVVDAPQHTHCRRWILRPDRVRHDPFSELTVRAHMHPGYQNPDFIGPSGPVDTAMTLLAVRSRDGRPIALLSNYSMHYFGEAAVSADYFGRFCKRLEEWIGPADRPLVAILSQGTAGDLHWMDYSQPKKNITIDQYADEVAQLARGAFAKIVYQDQVPLAMAQTTLRLSRRVPDQRRLDWARRVVADTGDRPPANWTEVYAREQIYLHDEPARELVLQAARVGELGLTAIPNEVFSITGLKLKAQSPLAPTMNLELANGCEGYIPPPEQHRLGGYTTWPARSAGLEVQAEPKIVEALLALLEKVAGRPRRPVVEIHGPYAQAVLGAKPLCYWRLADMAGVEAADATGVGRGGTFEGGVALYLEGAPQKGFSDQQINRAVHLAGGRIRVALAQIRDTYSVELWFWNGLPNDARPVTGHLFSLGADDLPQTRGGEHLAIGGTQLEAGKLIFYTGTTAEQARIAGQTLVAPQTWNHLVLVRQGKQVQVYLNGRLELAGAAPARKSSPLQRFFLGGRNDNAANFEGKLDEVAIYDRALPAEEVAAHWQAAGP